jgi:hypothetical protein
MLTEPFLRGTCFPIESSKLLILSVLFILSKDQVSRLTSGFSDYGVSLNKSQRE